MYELFEKTASLQLRFPLHCTDEKLEAAIMKSPPIETPNLTMECGDRIFKYTKCVSFVGWNFMDAFGICRTGSIFDALCEHYKISIDYAEWITTN